MSKPAAKMLKVGIIGCGKIADAHASQIRRISGCEITGVCDNEELMARQLAERFGIDRCFRDVHLLLKEAGPDIVHITTPPSTHFEMARQCLLSGCHVYVEKPFTVNAVDAGDLLRLAEERELKITVGHDLQYSHVSLRMRQMVREGYLGGNPVHMESYYCYNLGGAGYARALLGDKRHWVRSLPGKLLHNVISHGVARIAEYLAGESVQVLARGFVSPALRRAGEQEILDELRVILRDERETTAYFTFSSQMRPALNHFRIYGPQNSLALDQDTETLICLP